MDNILVCCNVCGREFIVNKNNYFVIENVPESSFALSEKTIDLKMVECGFCGAVQLYDVPLSENYESVYRSIGNSKELREYKKDQLKRLFDKYELWDKDILEFGCGNGQFLDIFSELGLDVAGVEFGEDNLKKCLEKKYNVSKDFPQSSYDTICCFHVLEHYPYPDIMLEEFRSLLNPEGIVILEVPNYDIIEDMNNWLEFTRDHRVYYRKRTLEYLLLSKGFEVIEVIEDVDTVCLTVIARKKKIKDSFGEMKYQMIRDIDDFKKVAGENFYVFGAGHYSQLLINLLYSKYKIKPKKIFDSNKDKCGGKICGIEVDHRDKILKYEIDRLIIICGIYNNEVEKMLKEINVNIKEIIKWD